MNTNKQQLPSTNLTATMVSLTIAGVTFQADANSIDKSKREVLHGEFLGEKVNSPAICEIEKNVIVWPEADETPAVSFSQAGLGVLAISYLKSKKHTVSAPV